MADSGDGIRERGREKGALEEALALGHEYFQTLSTSQTARYLEILRGSSPDLSRHHILPQWSAISRDLKSQARDPLENKYFAMPRTNMPQAISHKNPWVASPAFESTQTSPTHQIYKPSTSLYTLQHMFSTEPHKKSRSSNSAMLTYVL